MQHSAVYRAKSVDVVIMECGLYCRGSFNEMHRYDWSKYRTLLFLLKSRELVLERCDFLD